VDIVLRPTLYAMSTLSDAVETFRQAMDGNLSACRAFIYASNDNPEHDDLLFELVGGIDEDGYKQDVETINNICRIGQCLAKHGIVGDVQRDVITEEDTSTEFVARDYVATAMAHLNLSEREAWQTTMTSLVSALKAKYPKQETHSLKEYEEHDAWLDSIRG